MKRNTNYLLILSIILLYYGISGLFAAVRFDDKGLIEAEGKIIGLHEKAGARGAAFHPVITFTDYNGNVITFTSKTGSNLFKNQVGETIKVVYPPGAPEEARIKASLYKNISPVAFLLSGTVFFILWFAEAYKNSKKEEDLNEQK